MTRFRHDLILRMIKLLDAVLVTIPFAMCWYLYYAKRVASPYYAKGDYLVVALFFVLFIIFGRVYDAFLMSMQRISEIIYEQFLAAAARARPHPQQNQRVILPTTTPPSSSRFATPPTGRRASAPELRRSTARRK